MPASADFGLTPQHGQAFKARVGTVNQSRFGYCCPASIAGTGIGPAHVNNPARCEIGRENNIAKPAIAAVIDWRCAGHRHQGTVTVPQTQATALFADQCPVAIGKERQSPRLVEVADDIGPEAIDNRKRR